MQSARFLLAITISILVSSSVVLDSRAKDVDHHLVTFVVLGEGQTLEARKKYEAALRPIAERHGAEIAHAYDLFTHLSGTMDDAVRLRVWDLPGPETIEAINADPEYKALIAQRDAIHDMAALPLYLATSIADEGQVSDAPVLVDLVVMNEPYGTDVRDAYEAAVEPIAARYGLEKVAAFAIARKLAGEGPEHALRLNIWRLGDSEGMKRLGQDPDYKALEDERNLFHDFSQLTLFIGEAGA